MLELFVSMELCSTCRGACLNGRSTQNLGVSSKHTGPTGGIALQAIPALLGFTPMDINKTLFGETLIQHL